MMDNFVHAERLGLRERPQMDGVRAALTDDGRFNRGKDPLEFRLSKGFRNRHGATPFNRDGQQFVMIDIWNGNHVNRYYPVPLNRFLTDYSFYGNEG